MPQNRFKQDSKTLAPTKPSTSSNQQGRSTVQQCSITADADSSSWQRGQGGFSGRAKKDYLKWKRQQKAAAVSGDDSDWAPQVDSSKHGSVPVAQPALPDAHTPAYATAGAAATAGPSHAWPMNTKDDPSLPLQYRPLVAVPAAPFTCSSSSSTAGPVGHPTAAADAETAVAELVNMPCLDPAEVGFTAEGFQLDMPTRPHWQGVVDSAEELHALEEKEFTAWQTALLKQAHLPTDQQAAAAAPTTADPPQQQQQSSRAGGVGRLSFYEGRLEFWRQLWRTLEMPDIVLMIVDARNPLLHFSHALYCHITHHHKLPLIILLNKCDLIPAAAAGAWQQWLQQQLPGVQVVPVSAAEGQAAAAARAVVSKVFQESVERGGQQVKVQHFVGMSVDELLEASYARNTHAKRHVMQHNTAAAAAESDNADGEPAFVGTDDEGLLAAAVGAAVGADSDSDSGKQWSLKPSRLAKKAEKKAGSRASGRQQQGNAALDRKAGSKSSSVAGRHSKRPAANKAAPEETKQLHEPGFGNSSDTETEPNEMTAGIESFTLEHRLSSSFTSATVVAAAAAAARPGPAEVAEQPNSSSSSSKGWAADSRPVVIGLLGEPNVGKSSTLNSLLGAHRVAVSCHPGRTKHYQTHFMTDKLVLCDCPGIVFPRLDVSVPMQVLFGSYPIASCRQPYAVVRYLAEASWPRIHSKLGLKQQQQQQQQQQEEQEEEEQGHHAAYSGSNPPSSSSSSSKGEEEWSPWALCEALAEKRRWVLPRSGRLDTYRAANWLLRAALGGREGLGLAFMPPQEAHGTCV